MADYIDIDGYYLNVIPRPFGCIRQPTARVFKRKAPIVNKVELIEMHSQVLSKSLACVNQMVSMSDGAGHALLQSQARRPCIVVNLQMQAQIPLTTPQNCHALDLPRSKSLESRSLRIGTSAQVDHNLTRPPGQLLSSHPVFFPSLGAQCPCAAEQTSEMLFTPHAEVASFASFERRLFHFSWRYCAELLSWAHISRTCEAVISCKIPTSNCRLLMRLEFPS